MKSSPEQATPTYNTARVFDVRRFCVHDGDGIRTTVFFKGCPLRCAWCQNPEGISPARKPIRFKGRCIGCGECLKASRAGGITALNGEIRLDPEAAENWDEIIDLCPTGALRWDSREATADELMKELMRDAPFYAHGGGVTLSGGDPLMQPRFAREILKRLRESGVQTAVETELYARYEDAVSVLELADIIYADLKLMDSELHKKYTGVGNELILSNIKKLLSGELRERIIIRTPLIPTITATEENIAATARFIAGVYPAARFEPLNYNPLAASKYPLVGREYCLPSDRGRYGLDEMEAFYEIARRNGLQNIISE